MTEKRFTIKDSMLKDGYVIIDNEKEYTFPVLDSTLNHMFCKALNELHEENEELKQSNKELLLLVDTLKEQNMKFKTRLNDLGVEYYD